MAMGAVCALKLLASIDGSDLLIEIVDHAPPSDLARW